MAWPTDSWICSAICSAPRISVVSPLGHGGADSSARASSATRAAWASRSISSTSSQPRVPYWPRAAGYERRCVSPSPIDVAMIPAPHSRTRWSMRWPSLDTNHLAVSQIWYIASAMSAPCSPIVAVARTSRSPLSPARRRAGRSTHSLAHEPTCASPASSGVAARDTAALAAAIAVARAPAARADGVGRGRARRRSPTPTRRGRARRCRRPRSG